jgi:DNA invertase Pin-like site-specific DNA recombinase
VAVGLAEAWIRENLAAMKRVAFYVRVSTADGQSTENQTRALHEVAARSGWNVTAIFSDDGISGSKGRDRRPGLDALLKAVTRREVDLVAAWSVDRLGRSLPDLVTLLGELQGRGVDLFLHQQALDTSTPGGRMMFQMLGVFAEFERSLIRARVVAGLERTKAKGTRLGRPPLEAEKAQAIRALLASGVGIRETARRTGLSSSTVQRVHAAMTASQDRETIIAAA